jgi:hypothetical protein
MLDIIDTDPQTSNSFSANLANRYTNFHIHLTRLLTSAKIAVVDKQLPDVNESNKQKWLT